MAEAEVARGPHLVLADVADERGLVVGGLADLIDDVVGAQPALAPGTGAVPRAALAHLAPLGELVQPRRPRLGLRQAAQQRGQQVARVGHDAEVGPHVLADLGAVDVDVDDPARSARRCYVLPVIRSS